MSTPMIERNSALARTLAETLGTTAEALSKQFSVSGWGKEYISILSLKNSKAYGKRVLDSYLYGKCGKCENAYYVDNGDGKIGNGDLFLHSDGYFKVNREHAFRFVEVGKRYAVQESSKPWEGSNNPNLTQEAHEVLTAILTKKGHPFTKSTFDAALDQICKR